MERFTEYFSSSSFLAHGYCMTWRGDLITMHAVSDLIIAISYFIIPLALLYFVRRRSDIVHKGIFWLFAAFITVCGITHLFGLVTIWNPIYAAEGYAKLVTAAVSAVTAVAAWVILPSALRLPSPSELRIKNDELQHAIAEQTRAYAELADIKQSLEHTVAERTAEISEYAAKLEASNESLKQYAHMASHDLQEPLRKITAFADVFEEAVAEQDEDEAHFALQQIRGSTNRARDMVSSLLRLSSIGTEGVRKIRVDLEKHVGRAVELFDERIQEKNATFHLDLKVTAIDADPQLLDHIILNVIGNSLKFVAIDRAPEITICSFRTDTGTRITVADNGLGFDQSNTEKAFMPFVRLHDRSIADGSGVGLAVVRKGIDLMKWSCQVTSHVNMGTTFAIDIPDVA